MDSVAAPVETKWRHFANHAKRTTWSVRVASHPNLEVKEHIEEISMDAQADLRAQGYTFRCYP